MKARIGLYVVGAAVVLTAAAVTLAGVEKTVVADGHPEAKVSESRQNGKYQRTTEVFLDKILISKKQEVSTRDDGKIDVVFTRLFRDGEMIYASSFHKAQNRTIRSYYHRGKMTVEEGDEDGDGFFETMILFDLSEQPVEAFLKSKEGTVAQFSKVKLAEIKKSLSILSE